MQELISIDQVGIREDGVVLGDFHMHGVRPRFLNKFSAMGIELPDEIF